MPDVVDPLPPRCPLASAVTPVNSPVHGRSDGRTNPNSPSIAPILHHLKLGRLDSPGSRIQSATHRVPLSWFRDAILELPAQASIMSNPVPSGSRPPSCKHRPKSPSMPSSFCRRELMRPGLAPSTRPSRGSLRIAFRHVDKNVMTSTREPQFRHSASLYPGASLAGPVQVTARRIRHDWRHSVIFQRNRPATTGPRRVAE